MAERNRERTLTIALAVLASILAACYVMLEKYATRPAFDWAGSPAEMTQTAPPGGAAEVAFRVRKVRSECHTVPYKMRLEIVDSLGESFVVNQRSGIPNDLPLGSFERVVVFEVPRFAEPGQAYVKMHGVLTCEWPPGINWVVYQSLPAIPFVIEG